MTAPPIPIQSITCTVQALHAPCVIAQVRRYSYNDLCNSWTAPWPLSPGADRVLMPKNDELSPDSVEQFPRRPHGLLAPQSLLKTSAGSLARNFSPSFSRLDRICSRFLGHHPKPYAAARTSSPRIGGHRHSFHCLRLEAHAGNLRAARSSPRPRAAGVSRLRPRSSLINFFSVISRSQQGYRDLIDSFDDILIALSLEGEIRAVNRSFADLIGFSYQQIIGRPISDFLEEGSGDGPELIRRALPRFIERRHWSGIIEVRLKKQNAVCYYDCVAHAMTRDNEVHGLTVSDAISQRCVK